MPGTVSTKRGRTVFAAVLAAGGSRRYGRSKQLADFEGKPLVRRAAELAREVCDPEIILMGGADVAEVLYMKDPETVRRECQKCIDDGIQILAPGCAVAPATSTDNMLAMVEAAQGAYQQ